MMLADLGAEVIKIEPPWGAVGRIGYGALFGGASYTFHHLNLNKKGMALNLKDPKGLEIFKELVKKSDVVIQNFAPGTMERMGLGYDVLHKLNPRIIYAALSGFGQTGPNSSRGSYASVAEAISGHTRMTGDNIDPEGPPISQIDCMVAINAALTGYFATGMKPWELREKYPRPHLGGILPTKDGRWIVVAGHRPKSIDKIKERLGVEEVSGKHVRDLVASMTQDEAVDWLVDAEAAVAPIYNVDETAKDPHVIARNMFIEVDHPKAGKVKVCNFPIKFSEMPIEVKRAAPLLGQHNKETLMELLGFTDDQIDELEKEGVIVTEKS
jgi:crotonobetainyl-CoA:carnitine CoA-transferase CaiB-like acyl-CoA transferase